MMVIGKMERWMDMVLIVGKKDKFMKVISSMVTRME